MGFLVPLTTNPGLFELVAERGAEGLFVLMFQVHVVDLKVSPLGNTGRDCRGEHVLF